MTVIRLVTTRQVHRALAGLAFVCAAILSMPPAWADSCARSRDFILSSGTLSHKPAVYKKLFAMCMQTLRLPNVKDAFILTEGGIAVVPRIDRVSATAGTLAQFCTRFPHGTLHFISGQTLARTSGIGQMVRIPHRASTPCSRITGR
jgi:hypothetical protein